VTGSDQVDQPAHVKIDVSVIVYREPRGLQGVRNDACGLEPRGACEPHERLIDRDETMSAKSRGQRCFVLIRRLWKFIVVVQEQHVRREISSEETPRKQRSL
jgi:hypothetical protein